MFALVGLAMWLAWRLRLRRIERQFDLVLAERSRMGREIHDTLLQSLVGVALEFDDISEQLGPSSESLSRQVRRIRQQVEHYIREARQSIWNLRSPLLQTSDLPTALKHCAHAAIAGNRARFEFTVEGTARRAAARVEEQLLRIGQEAVSNAARHSGADTIKASICYSASKVSLTVRDDGCGFDLNQVDTAADGHWGVISMRERAQQIGATLHLTSAAGSGTAVEVTALLPRSSHEVAQAAHQDPVRGRSPARARGHRAQDRSSAGYARDWDSVDRRRGHRALPPAPAGRRSNGSRAAADVGHPGIEEIRREDAAAKIVVLTVYSGDEDIYRAIHAGAASYLLKDTLSNELVSIVRQVYRGERPMPEAVASRLASRLGHAGLSMREIEILELIAGGKRNKEIADILGIAQETVQTHIKRLFLKLNVND